MPRPRLLRYSLRSMLLVVLVLSVWLGYYANRAARQRRAVALVEELGGVAKYDYELHSDSERYKRPGRPTWLRKTLGADWFSRVILLKLGETSGSDDDIARLINDLPDIMFLDLHATPTGDSALRDVCALKELLFLNLKHTDITDEALRHLRECRQLADLSLDGTGVSDAGLVYLSRLENLVGLSLDDTNVTDAGLAHLMDLPSLSMLTLNGTKVTDAAVREILTSGGSSHLMVEHKGRYRYQALVETLDQ